MLGIAWQEAAPLLQAVKTLAAVSLCTLGLSACGGAIPTPISASAPPPPPLVHVDAAPTREAIAIEGSDLVHGRSRLIVRAGIDKVRKHVLDFDHYAEFMPHYQAARLIKRTSSGGRLVYMEVAALSGLITMWTKIEMQVARHVGKIETHASRFLDGNVDDFVAIWRLRKIDDAHTEMSLEIFLEPSLPLPDSLINSENVGGAFDGVVAMRTRIEGRPRASADE
jgi:ribosome-associated toxin RatA of RatAB toxin-antitoxin module